MAKQQEIDDKVNTPAQGAEGATEQPKEPVVTQLEAKEPEWVKAILESNAALAESNANLIASNEDVLSGLDSFKEHAASFVQEIVEKSLPAIPRGTGTAEDFNPTQKHIHPDADYVVAEGQSFADKNDITKKYSEGEDVTHLGAERLQGLLNQGLIEEA